MHLSLLAIQLPIKHLAFLYCTKSQEGAFLQLGIIDCDNGADCTKSQEGVFLQHRALHPVKAADYTKSQEGVFLQRAVGFVGLAADCTKSQEGLFTACVICGRVNVRSGSLIDGPLGNLRLELVQLAARQAKTSPGLQSLP